MKQDDTTGEGLADELGGTRARLTALKAQQDAVRSETSDRVNPTPTPQAFGGQTFALRIVRHTSRRLNAKALPLSVRNDPAYFRTTHTVHLTSKAVHDCAQPIDKNDGSVIKPWPD